MSSDLTSEGLVLVTGATSGIGRRLALDLATESRLILHGRNQQKLENLHADCGGGNHLIWLCDFSLDKQIGSSLAKVLSNEFVRISKFVHCAGDVRIQPSRRITTSTMAKQFSVNVFSALEIVGTLLRPTMNGDTLENVVFVSSIWSMFGAHGHVEYASSKGALDAAMKSLAIENAPRVRFNSLVLGAVDTPMSRSALENPEIHSSLLKQYPLGIGTPQDVSEFIRFLISRNSSWLTGQQIVLDGGRTANASLTANFE